MELVLEAAELLVFVDELDPLVVFEVVVVVVVVVFVALLALDGADDEQAALTSNPAITTARSVFFIY